MEPIARVAARSAALSSALLLVACNFTQAGIDPPASTLNFPIAIELSPARDASGASRYLVVVSSNFDLRFNSGAIMAIDLAALDDAIANTNGCPGEDCALWPLAPMGSSETTDPDSGRPFVRVIADEVGIGSHADGLAFNAAGDRMYLPMRGESDLTFVPFDAQLGAFRCSQMPRNDDDVLPRCADRFRTGRVDTVGSTRGLALMGSPTAISTGSFRELGVDIDAEYIVMALQGGTVALYLDSLDREAGDGTPELIHVAEGFPATPVTMTVQPGTGVAWITSVASNVTAAAERIARVAISADPVTPSRSFLYDFGSVRLADVDDGQDVRDIVFHPSDPTRAFVLTRRPEAVVELAVDRQGLTQSDIAVTDIWEVGAGPSRIAVLELAGRTYVFASCYDAQRLFVIDADHGSLVGVVGGFSGPFEIAIDPVTERLYMTDFATSVIRIVDLSPLEMGLSPTVIGTVGRLRPVRGLTN
ncbi:MAG: YncE family protein [Sandaracinaceae bacterium]